MAHPVAERALAHFNALFPLDEVKPSHDEATNFAPPQSEDDSGIANGELEKSPDRAIEPSNRDNEVAGFCRDSNEAKVSMSDRPTLVSLFAGAGGLDIGLEQAGFRSIYATDINHDACQTLRANRGLFDLEAVSFERWVEEQVFSQRCHTNMANLDRVGFVRRIKETIGRRCIQGPEQVVEGDIRQLSSAKILADTGLAKGELDLLAGGPPCQPFSRAGKREMMRASDGLLFLEFIRLINDLQPRFFLFENVKGMVIQKSPIKRIECTECGYLEMPRFETIYLIDDGEKAPANCSSCSSSATFVRQDEVRGGALQIVENEFRMTGYRTHSAVLNAANYGAPQSRERIIIVGSRDGENFRFPLPTHAANVRADEQSSLFPNNLRPWVTMAESIFAKPHPKYGGLSLKQARLWVKNVVRPHDEPVTWTLDRIAPTVGAHQSAKLAIAPFGVPEAQLQRQQWHVRGRRQGDTPPVPVEHEYLSDEELLMLQTFPTDWYLHGTRMERAFQIGNAVPPILAKAVGSALMSHVKTQIAEAA